MAYRLSTYFDVPWILHMSDPWTVSPVHSIECAKQWNEEMEAKCFRRANVISFTSLMTIKLYAEKYPEFKSKMAFYPNVYDEKEAKINTWIKGGGIRIVYTGGFVGDRTPLAFIKAMSKLNETRPEVARDFEVIFAGSLDRKNTAYFEGEHAGITHLGSLPYSEAIELQNSADILLLIDLHFEKVNEAMFFPSKLLDYMLAKRRVIAITDVNSTTWQVVKDGQLGDCVQHCDVDLIVTLLINAWNAWNDNHSDYFEFKEVNPEYSARFNAKKLSIEIKGLCCEK
jgi:glycosyltransferase involved in cell wall biosynthesis